MNSGETLLLTACIQPKGVPFLSITDPEVRLTQYIHSILKWLSSPVTQHIVVCDNSGFKADFSELSSLAAQMNKEFEFISFSGNDYSAIYGKGYGEGEIMEYALSHSDILNRSNVFYKVTGRLFVLNHKKIFAAHSRDSCVFSSVSFREKPRIRRVDTRFFKVSLAAYNEFLKDSYREVRDFEGYYLENAYYDSLKKSGIRVESFKYCPRYDGLSGTTGRTYHEKRIKFFVKNLLYRMGCYRI